MLIICTNSSALISRFCRVRVTIAMAFYASIAMLCNTVVAQSSDANFFDDKTVNVYIGRGPGSGTDIALRTFIDHWRNHIPGRPTMVVRNIPGGGGTRVWNYGYEVGKQDGLTILFSPFSGAAEILGLPGLRADFSRMPLLGGLKSPNLVYVRRPDVRNPSDLLRIDGLKYAGQNPAHHYDILARLALDMLGVDYNYISGFAGADAVFNAVRRGEVEMQTAGLTLYRFSIEQTLIETGEAIALWHNPSVDRDGNIVPEEAAGDIPTFVDVYRELMGEEPTGEQYEGYKWLQPTINTFGHAAFMPPDSPAAAVEILRNSFRATSEDPDFRAEEERLFSVRMPLIEHEEGTRIVAEMSNPPDYVRELLEKYVGQSSSSQ
jgi:tripartite-type tricarboxylate transporter receptor subunit TctC